MTWTKISEQVYFTDTDAEILEAKEALKAAELDQAVIFVGDPDSPDCYANGQILFA